MSNYVYIVEATGTGLFKIGVATNLKDRIGSLQTGCPYKLRLVHACEPANPYQVEKDFHLMAKDFRVIGEWFQLPQEVVKKITVLMSLPLNSEDGVRAEVIRNLEISDPNQLDDDDTLTELRLSFGFDADKAKFVKDLLLSGYSKTRVVKELLGCKGRRYQEGAKFLDQLLSNYGDESNG